jgi:hypothetical protein
MNWINLAHESNIISENGSGPSGSIKSREFLD